MSIKIGNDIVADNTKQASSQISGKMKLYSDLGSNTDGTIDQATLTNQLTFKLNFNQITNCITSCPHDINLELVNHVLTLKSGSKLVSADGSYYTTEEDVSIEFDLTDWSDLIVVYDDTAATPAFGLYISGANGTSGPTPPTVLPTTSDYVWYDTSTNTFKVSHDSTETWTSIPLPIATINVVKDIGITEISNIFDCIGYIDKILFIKKDMVTLGPNGKNADGTLNNMVFTTNHLEIKDLSTIFQSDVSGCYATFNSTDGLIINASRSYNESSNYLYNGDAIQYGTEIAEFDLLSGTIQNFQCYYPIKLASFSNVNNLMVNMLDLLYPVGAIYIGTQSTCPMSTLIPGSSWTLVSAGNALWCGNGSNANTYIEAGLPAITHTHDGTTDFRNPDHTHDCIRTDGTTVSTTWVGDHAHAYGGMTNNTGASGGHNHQYSGPVHVSARTGLQGAGGNHQHYYVTAANTAVSAIYGKSTTVQPPAYVVNVWRRSS